MKRTLALVFCAIAIAQAVLTAQEAPEAKQERAGGLLSRMWPFGGERLPKYKDPRLRGLVLELKLSPEPVKLSEVRQLGVNLRLTNRSKRPVSLDFPTAQRIEIQLLNSTETVLTRWSDNRAFAEVVGTVLINSQEHIDYNETIATRDLSPNKVYIVEVLFPKYPELRIRQKFLAAP